MANRNMPRKNFPEGWRYPVTSQLANAWSMASRVPSVNLRHIRRRQPRHNFNGSLKCWYLSVRQESQRSQWQTGRHAPSTGRRWDVSRDGSTLASLTAIDNTKEVPSNVRALYDALTAVKQCAGAYVDLSRLQLALRSLEAPNPVVRVASECSTPNRGEGSLATRLI